LILKNIQEEALLFLKFAPFSSAELEGL